MNEQLNKLATRIRQAKGDEPADVVIKNVDIFSLTTSEITHGDIAICDDTIIGVGDCYQGKTEISGQGLTAVPGFIDSHVHVESSLLMPYEFERCILPLGTTTVVCDPHELTNVCGTQVFDFFLKCSENMVMDMYVALSSCVPSTDMETAGAKVFAADLKKYATHSRVSGLAELMNVPGVLYQVEDSLEKIFMFSRRIDGHAPELTGKGLNAYLSCGVLNDHECSTLEEALDKLNRGMHILLREGTVARNLTALAPIITAEHAPFLGLCTDDKHCVETLAHGHINYMVGNLLQAGYNPLTVFRIASMFPAQMFGFKDRGILAPGYRADIVLLSDFKKCQVGKVIKSGKLVCQELFDARKPMPDTSFCRHSICHVPVSARDLVKKSTESRTDVIGIRPLSLLTDHLEYDLPIVNGEKQISLEKDIAKIAVIDRYHAEGHISVGYVKGFQMKKGALASSVGHDSHNICVVGVSDEDMAVAVNEIIKMGGGDTIAIDGKIVSSLALPLGGLMSDKCAEEVKKIFDEQQKGVTATGTPLDAPFLQLSFLPLPVIPHLRITDKGMVDVDKFAILEE